MAAIVGERFCSEEERELTVRKTSLFFPGDGFAVYDHITGDLVFRVDTYARGGPAFADQPLLLMDPSGDPILTLRRKVASINSSSSLLLCFLCAIDHMGGLLLARLLQWPSLHHRWEAFLGERSEGQKPLFAVRRSSIFGNDRSAFAVEVHSCGGSEEDEEEYRIEGSFPQRCCRVFYEGGRGGKGAVVMVAEIKRKVDACSHVVLGRDVFSLCLRPRCDAAFAMGLIIVLDRISGDDDDVIDDAEAKAIARLGAATIVWLEAKAWEEQNTDSGSGWGVAGGAGAVVIADDDGGDQMQAMIEEEEQRKKGVEGASRVAILVARATMLAAATAEGIATVVGGATTSDLATGEGITEKGGQH
ncbi:hypothetical protein B296_00034900 [Ensete ventricosum]|uniref:Uncharacterized protein n=1 Tax=Ensete ventricosum TaxID=4639 RepID=A0A426YR61_ENSVE|nr:hypothetical protein B296_00034900 [Ensete ventricosum]